MAQKLKAVDEYLIKLPSTRQEALQTVRTWIFEAVPDVVETMKYNMPTYERDEVVCSLASQKNYMSLYLDVALVEAYKTQLSHLNCGKSCVRFKKAAQLPAETIKKILQETVKKQQHDNTAN